MNDIDEILALVKEECEFETFTEVHMGWRELSERLESMLRLAVSQRDEWRRMQDLTIEEDAEDNAALEKLARGEE